MVQQLQQLSEVTTEGASVPFPLQTSFQFGRITVTILKVRSGFVYGMDGIFTDKAYETPGMAMDAFFVFNALYWEEL